MYLEFLIFLIFLFLLFFNFLLWCLISFCICGFPWATRPCTCPLCLFTSYSELLLLPFSPFGLLFLAATFHELPRVFLLLFKVFSNVLCAVKWVFLQRFLWLWSRSLLSVLFNLWQDIPHLYKLFLYDMRFLLQTEPSISKKGVYPIAFLYFLLFLPALKDLSLDKGLLFCLFV